jgi:hypothetical protein
VSASEVFVNDLDLSTRAKEAIFEAVPFVRNPTVRQVIENVTTAQFAAMPGVGDKTIDEIQAAFRSACDVSLIDRRAASAPAPAVVEAEAPKKSTRKKAR